MDQRSTRMSASATAWRHSCLLLLVASLTAACDNTFEPIEPGGPPFSVFGYLDAAADTQWIRINPLRSLLLAGPDPSGVSAALENLGTGAVIGLRDSTLRFGNMLGSGPVYAHGFWTTERIEPGATYRFRATRTDSAIAESTVKIPRDYGLEVWVSERITTDPGGGSGPGTPYLSVSGLKQLPFLIFHSYYYDDCIESGHARQVRAMDPGGDSVARLIYPPSINLQVSPACGRPRITKQEVEVVGSETQWPFGLDWSTWRLDAGDLPSTVTNSLGFLGGVLVKWIPLEGCAFAYISDTQRYCKLRYDSTTATLRGTVTSGCGIVDSIAVELRELVATPPDPPRVRTARRPDRAGNYEIGALRAGVPHRLTIFAGDTSNVPLPRQYQVYYDTLQFSPGQVTTVNANLQHFGTCPRS